MAANTGRSGQPVQKFGGRGGMSPTAAVTLGLCASICIRVRGNGIGIDAGRTRLRQERRKPAQQDFGRVVAAARQAALAEHARLDVGAAQDDIDLLLDIVGRAFLDHQHGALAGAKLLHFLRHQRIGDVEHIDRNARDAVEIGEIEPRQRAQQPVGEAAEHDDADLADVARRSPR